MTTKTYPPRATGPAPATLDDLITELLYEDGHDPTDEIKRAEYREEIRDMCAQADRIRQQMRDNYYAHRVRRGMRLCQVHRHAIQGQDGSGVTFGLAVSLVRGLVLKMEDALRLLDEVYSPRCVPPWPYGELVHKVEDAEYKSDKPWGYLLRESLDADDVGGREDPRRPPGSAASSPSPSANSTGMTAASKPPAKLATAEIIGVFGLRTPTESRDVDGLQLRVLDGPYAGRERRLQLDWPTTARSEQRWRHVALAVGLDEIREPRRELSRRRIGIELQPDPRFAFKIGNIHPAPPRAS